MYMKKWTIAMLLLLSVIGTHKMTTVQAIHFDQYFGNYSGTIVIKDLSNNETQIFNKDLASKRLPPQSTFKIPNALIGLQTGAVQGKGHLKEWNGIVSAYPAHNSNHTLASAIQHSVVWYFQEMAKEIGIDQMQEWINDVGYGNKDISGGIDHFWLESSLLISPIEQVEFIMKLYKEELPFEKNSMKTVKEMITLKDDKGYVLAGKTGTKSNLGGGWFVGYVSYQDRTHVFATYLDGPNVNGLKAREITENIIHGEIVK